MSFTKYKNLPLNPQTKLTDLKDEPSAAFKLLASKPDQAEIVDWKFRGVTIPIRIRVPSMNEYEMIKGLASKALNDAGVLIDKIGPRAFEDQFLDAVAAETLAVAIQEGEAQETGENKFAHYRFFKNSKEVKMLSPDEFAGLHNLFLITKEKFGGFKEAQDILDNLDAWIDVVAEGAKFDFLSRLPLVTLVSVMQGMARAIQDQSSKLSQQMNLEPIGESLQETYQSENLFFTGVVSGGESEKSKSEPDSLELATAELATEPIEKAAKKPKIKTKEEIIEAAKKLET